MRDPLPSKKKLSPGHQHILTLIRKEARDDGWTPVSKAVAPLFTDANILGGPMPAELCEFESIGEGGRARLTQMGNNVLDAMAWLP